MEAKTKSWVVLPFLLLVAIFMQQSVHGESQVLFLVVFGDYVYAMEITTTFQQLQNPITSHMASTSQQAQLEDVPMDKCVLT